MPNGRKARAAGRPTDELESQLEDAFGAPLVSTSANRAGDPPPRQLRGIEPSLLDALDGWIEGDTGALAAPTEIREARSGAVLRGA